VEQERKFGDPKSFGQSTDEFLLSATRFCNKTLKLKSHYAIPEWSWNWVGGGGGDSRIQNPFRIS